MSWYYATDGVQKGPVLDEAFQELVSGGTIKADTLVWREGMAEWKSYGEMAAAKAGTRATVKGPPSPVAGDVDVCAECGGTFSRNNMVAYESSLVCSGCRDVFFQRIREGVQPAPTMQFAGFWIRFLAKFIDGILLAVVNTVIILLLGLALSPVLESGFESEAAADGFMLVYFLQLFIQLAVGIGYSVFFVGRFGATPGKMALSLKIVRADGGKVTYMRATGRAFAEYISSFILGIGYIMAAFDDEKRTLHDRICDTRVIRT